jgi:transposase
MVTTYMFNRIRELSSQGMKARAIARELGLDRKTVGRYLKLNAPPRYKERSVPSRQDPCKPFMEAIGSMLRASPDAKAYDIYALLQEQGYTGSMRTLERRVASIKGEREKERFFEQKYVPGEQAQFDFKEKVLVPFIDGERIVHLLYGTFPFSDFFSIKAFPNKAFEAFIEGVHSFFEASGGMSEGIRFDNLSPCVKKVLKGGRRIYTDRFAKALAYYDFKDLPCRPGKGNDKGDVEREIRTQTRRIARRIELVGRVFLDFDDLNSWLIEQCRRELTPAAQKRHEEERSYLKPLPPREEEVLCQILCTTASPFGTVTINKSSYSVPDNLIGVSCRLVLDAYRLRVYRAADARKLIVEYSRIESGEHKLELAHILPSLVRKPHAMVRWAHRELLFPSNSCHRFFAFLARLNPESQEREYLKTLNLIQYVTLAEIEMAMDIVRKNNSKAPFDDVKFLLLCSSESNQQGIEQTPLKPSLAIYDDFIPNNVEDSA